MCFTCRCQTIEEQKTQSKLKVSSDPHSSFISYSWFMPTFLSTAHLTDSSECSYVYIFIVTFSDSRENNEVLTVQYCLFCITLFDHAYIFQLVNFVVVSLSSFDNWKKIIRLIMLPYIMVFQPAFLTNWIELLTSQIAMCKLHNENYSNQLCAHQKGYVKLNII